MSDFASRLITWQKQHGRHDLPWQNTRDPYAIWVSEIMLQQTQVAAVIGYYAKFMQRFPDIAALANATQEEVLQYWSGLGYYSRARNLHNSAAIILDEHEGKFPQDFNTIQTFPGIGRSTAAAIVSFAFNQAQTILDGNVKRVLARHYVVEGWPGTPKIEKELWLLAERLLPNQDVIAYTQGLMDLGATLCTRSKPQCAVCPLNHTCKAYEQKRVHALPTPKLRQVIPEKYTTMVILRYGDEVMLEKRLPKGIWGGLWSFPQADEGQVEQLLNRQFEISAVVDQSLPTLIHTFTHFKLHIQPLVFWVEKLSNVGHSGQIWLGLEEAIGAAIPTPVRKILQTLQKTPSGKS